MVFVAKKGGGHRSAVSRSAALRCAALSERRTIGAPRVGAPHHRARGIGAPHYRSAARLYFGAISERRTMGLGGSEEEYVNRALDEFLRGIAYNLLSTA